MLSVMKKISLTKWGEMAVFVVLAFFCFGSTIRGDWELGVVWGFFGIHWAAEGRRRQLKNAK